MSDRGPSNKPSNDFDTSKTIRTNILYNDVIRLQREA